MITAFSGCSINDLNDFDGFNDVAMDEDRITPTTDGESSKFMVIFLILM